MRPKLQKLTGTGAIQSFSCYEVKVPYFDFFWHFHPEYELTFIVKGRGKRLVGDSIENFTAGDIVLLGPMLPHVWVSEEKSEQGCEALVVQFPETVADKLTTFPDLAAVKTLLDAGIHGCKIQPLHPEMIFKKAMALTALEPAECLTACIELLYVLSKEKLFALVSQGYRHAKPLTDAHRINKVLSYIQKHFKREISLKKAAECIHLSESASSKYFKRTMGKTFSAYVNQVRITHACSLLIETDQPVSLVAHLSGFENLSYFNRVFLQQKKISPTALRKLKSK